MQEFDMDGHRFADISTWSGKQSLIDMLFGRNIPHFNLSISCIYCNKEIDELLQNDGSYLFCEQSQSSRNLEEIK